MADALGITSDRVACDACEQGHTHIFHNMKNKHPLRKTAPITAMTLLTVIAGTAPYIQAADFFTVTTETNDLKPVLTDRKDGSGLEGLLKEAIAAESYFKPFVDRGFKSFLTWGGVPNVLIFEQKYQTTPQNEPGEPTPPYYYGDLTSGLIRGGRLLAPRFYAKTQGDLGNQVANYFEENGGELYTELMKAVSATAKTSPTDGNPNAETARNSAGIYGSDAMVTGETRAEKKAGSSSTNPAEFQIDANLGTFKASGITGTTYSIPLAKRFSLSERVGLNIGIPLSYTQIGKANVYSGGINVGFPITLIEKTAALPVTWRVTPFGGASVTASRDILIGGAILRGGVSNLLAYDFGNFELAVGNHFSQHSSVAMDVGGTKIDPGVDQQIMKHGIQICVPVAENWVIEGYAIRTDFLAAAGVKQFFTYGGDIGYRIRDKRSAVDRIVGTLRLGAYIDTGSGFTGMQVRIGSSWKF